MTMEVQKVGRTAIADIAKRLGIGHGTFYRHFKNKRDILDHVIDEVYEKFASEVRKLVDFDRININIIDPGGEVFTVKNLLGDRQPGRQVGDVIPLAESRTEHIMATGQSMVQDDLSETCEDADKGLYELGIRSSMAIPLISKEKVIGTLNVRSRKVGTSPCCRW